MKLSATFRIALRALRRNKMRSLLTMLGIIIGVGAVIAMVGVGNGARAQVEARLATLGENMILIYAGSINAAGVRIGFGNAGTLKTSDAEAILREIPGVTAVSPETRAGVQVMLGHQNWYTNLIGESPEYFDMRQWAFTAGSSFMEEDVKSASKVVVLGQTVATQLFGNEDPIGRIIRVKHVPFMVVGVLRAKGLSLQGQDQDDVVIVPYTTAMKRLTGATILRTINVQASNPKIMEQAQQLLSDLLRQRHRIIGGRDDDFTVRNQQEIAEVATAQSKTMFYLLVAIAIVSLVVGGIGIMNIMLVSVTERTREIGIRIAIGAHGRDILLQFLIEAVTLSCMGGFVGIILGYATAETISHFARWPTTIPLVYVLLAFLSSAVVGIISGFYPAYKAAALDPIDALRYE